MGANKTITYSGFLRFYRVVCFPNVSHFDDRRRKARKNRDLVHTVVVRATHAVRVDGQRVTAAEGEPGFQAEANSVGDDTEPQRQS